MQRVGEGNHNDEHEGVQVGRQLAAGAQVVDRGPPGHRGGRGQGGGSVIIYAQQSFYVLNKFLLEISCLAY